MKRNTIIFAALLTLAGFVYVYSQDQRRPIRRDVTSARATAEIAKAPKGKLLVEKLPEGAEGVVIEKGVVKTQPGYKFVDKDKQVMVMRIGAGGGGQSIGGSWNCGCSDGGGGCETVHDDNAILCRKVIGKDGCAERCELSIVIKGFKSQIVQY